MNINVLRNFAASLVFLSMVIACGGAPTRQSVSPNVVKEQFSEPLGVPLSVRVGDSIYSQGQVAYKQNLRLAEEYQGTMPGAYRVPFSFSVQSTVLDLRYARGDHDYYCADDGKASASFPGLGSVIAQGDCVGVRVHKESGEIEWVVDNSNHNRQTTVWSTKYDEQDDPQLIPDTTRFYDAALELTEIRFDGFYSDLLHFTLVEHKRGEVEERAFRFDYPPQRGEAIYGIRGQTFEVLNVSNVGMEYKWLELN